MKHPARYFGVAALLTLAVGIAVMLTARRPVQLRVDVKAPDTERKMPLAIAEHMEKLQRALPGNAGESREGPGGAEAEHFLALAYPGTDIP